MNRAEHLDRIAGIHTLDTANYWGTLGGGICNECGCGLRDMRAYSHHLAVLAREAEAAALQA